MLAFTAPAVAADAVFGTFALEGGQCAVTALEDLGSGKFHYRATRRDGDGREHHQDGIFAFDGRALDDGAGGSLAFTRIDEHRYAIIAKGVVRGLAMRTLSDDGSTMTEVADGTDDGEAFHAVRVWRRGDGGCD